MARENMELKFDKERNRKERLEFIHYYAEWVKRVPNDVWSRKQAIDSFMANAANFKMTPEEYIEMKNRAERKKRRSSLTKSDEI